MISVNSICSKVINGLWLSDDHGRSIDDTRALDTCPGGITPIAARALFQPLHVASARLQCRSLATLSVALRFSGVGGYLIPVVSSLQDRHLMISCFWRTLLSQER